MFTGVCMVPNKTNKHWPQNSTNWILNASYFYSCSSYDFLFPVWISSSCNKHKVSKNRTVENKTIKCTWQNLSIKANSQLWNWRLEMRQTKCNTAHYNPSFEIIFCLCFILIKLNLHTRIFVWPHVKSSVQNILSTKTFIQHLHYEISITFSHIVSYH